MGRRDAVGTAQHVTRAPTPMSDNYLDHAATSWPKAPGVAEAVAHWFAELGVSADRGDSRRCAEVAARVRSARSRLARRCGVPEQRVAFTAGATDGLNLALRGLLRAGDRVVTTATEHSSVARPLRALRDDAGIAFDVVPCDAHGRVDPDDVARAIRAARTRLLVVSHAGNVTGAVHDVGAMISPARAAGALVVLDASQTAGVLPLDVGADVVIASAHKGLLAPPGLGFVAAREGVVLRATRQGGTGSSAALDEHPTEWPALLEAGTPNTPAILGLARALDWLDQESPESLTRGAHAVADELEERLRERRTVRVLRPPAGAPRLPIVSFVDSRFDPAELGVLLDEAGVVARTGFHCAPWIHAALGTTAAGTVRLSPGPFVSAAAPRLVLAALAS